VGEGVATGICRIENGWATQDSVIVRYADGKEEEIPATQYLAQGYHPLIETLPLCKPTPERQDDAEWT
jgi:hypothetical protein